MRTGRLTLNVSSSDFPGETTSCVFRYQRRHEVAQIPRQAWECAEITPHRPVDQFDKAPTGAAKPDQLNGGPRNATPN